MNQDSVVLLTGGSRGIGLEIAKEVSKITKKIAIVGRNKEALANAAEVTGAKTFSADVTDHVAMKKIVSDVRALWGISRLPAIWPANTTGLRRSAC